MPEAREQPAPVLLPPGCTCNPYNPCEAHLSDTAQDLLAKAKRYEEAEAPPRRHAMTTERTEAQWATIGRRLWNRGFTTWVNLDDELRGRINMMVVGDDAGFSRVLPEPRDPVVQALCPQWLRHEAKGLIVAIEWSMAFVRIHVATHTGETVFETSDSTDIVQSCIQAVDAVKASSHA